jgi:predicted RNA binding protein YcfA (HicA-like mRNA interferase family)
MCKKDDITRCKTSAELVSYARHHGGAVVRQSGSHAIVQGPAGGTCPVPMHTGDIPTGTRCSILKRFRAIGLVLTVLFLVVAYGPAILQMM